MLHSMGAVAGSADDAVIAEKPHYLRGRELEEMNDILRGGARAAGYRGEIEAHPTEMAALRALLERSTPGDVCAVMAHVERSDLFEWLDVEGYRPVGVERLREVIGA